MAEPSSPSTEGQELGPQVDGLWSFPVYVLSSSHHQTSDGVDGATIRDLRYTHRIRLYNTNIIRIWRLHVYHRPSIID